MNYDHKQKLEMVRAISEISLFRFCITEKFVNKSAQSHFAML